MLTIFIITRIRNKFTNSTTTAILLKHQTNWIVKFLTFVQRMGTRDIRVWLRFSGDRFPP